MLDGFYCVPTKMDRNGVCPRQVSPFNASGKSMILLQVPLLPSIKLNQHSGAVLNTVFSSCWLLLSWTRHAFEQRHSVNKWRRQAFACRLFRLYFTSLQHVSDDRSTIFCLTPVSAMVSTKISRGKFPRPGPGTSALRMLLRLTTANQQAAYSQSRGKKSATRLESE